MQVEADYQVHTGYSGRAEDRMTHAAVVDAAPQLGLSAVGFTDHIYGHTTIAELEMLERGVRAVEHPTVRAWFGIEAEMINEQRTTVFAGWRDRFDYVLLALDHAKACDYDVPDHADVAAWVEHYQRGYALAGEGGVDVLAHPFSGCLEALDAINDDDLHRMLEHLARADVAIELNGIRLNRAARREPYLRLYRAAMSLGIKFSTGSDAHMWDERSEIHHVQPWLDELQVTKSQLWSPTRR